MARKEDALLLTDMKRLFATELRKKKLNPGILSYKPHPIQERFHRSNKKGKMMMGGNRAGKTVSGACESVMRLIGKHPYRDDLPKPPIRARGVAVDFDRGVNLIMIPELKKWMPTEYLIDGLWERSYSKTERMLTLTNGSTMEFMSYEQDPGKFQGTSRHLCWFDEEPPHSIFNECMTRLIDTNGDWFITMTPLIEMSWTYDTLYEPAQAGLLVSVEVFEANTSDNPHIDPEAFELLTQTLSEEERKTRATGVYISHTGLIYGEVFSQINNVIPDIVQSSRFDILRKHWSHFQMMDHGYNNPTAFLFACYDSDGKVIIYDELYINKTIVSDIAEMVKKRRLQLDIPTEYVVCDPSIASTDPLSGSSVQAEYGENGIFIALGNNDVQSGIARVQETLRYQQLIISKRCTETLKEIRKYRWDRHLTKMGDRKNKKEVPVKKDDHAMDAMRYGLMSRPKHYEKVAKAKFNDLNATRTATDFDWELVEKDNQLIDFNLGVEF